MAHFSFLSFYFPLYLTLFFVAAYVSFYLPGALVLSNKKYSTGLKILLPLVIGIVLWGFQGYIFGYLHLRFLTYLYLFFVLIFSLKKKIITTEIIKESFTWIKRNIFPVVAIIILVILQLTPIFTSGMLYFDGVRFIGVNSTDGVMHLAFIQSIAHYFPPIEPGSYANPLTNYHYWSDLIMAEIVRIWKIPVANVFFQFFPMVLSVLTAISAYQLVRQLGFSSKAGYCAIFLLFFGGDATYVLMMFFRHELTFSTPVIDNGMTQFLNMPNAFARPIFITGILTFYLWLKEAKIFWGIITVLIFASLFGIKIYYGIFVLIGFSFVLLYKCIEGLINKQWNIIKVAKDILRSYLPFYLVFIFVSFAIYFPPNKMSGGLGWYPLEWPKIFLGSEVLNWGDWWLRHQVYEQANNIKGILFLDTVAIVIALISIHGTRLLGFFSLLEVRKISPAMLFFLGPAIIIFHVFGLFTLQSSGGLNVFNFFVVTTVILSIMLAMGIDLFFVNRKKIQIAFVIIITLLTVPRALTEIVGYSDSSYNPKKYHLISNDEVEAFEYIRKNTKQDSIIQSHPVNPVDAETPYVSYFSDRFSYLSGVRLQITHNQPVGKRSKEMHTLFSSTDSPTFFAKAKEYNLDLIYIQKNVEQKLKFFPDKNLIKPIFENNSVIVYKISE